MRKVVSGPILLWCTLVLILTGAGCSAQNDTALDMDLASQPTFYMNSAVERSPVQVYVFPDVPPQAPPKTLFMPFRVTQRMENASIVGYNLSRLVWQTWLQTQVFPVLEFAQTSTPYRPDIALALASQKGADMVVGGYISHILDGGTTGDSSVSISIEAYDVRTGNLMWSMAQGGVMQKAKVSDYLLFAVQSRLPNDPMAAIICTLAADMGQKVRDWITPPTPQSPWYKYEPKAF